MPNRLTTSFPSTVEEREYLETLHEKYWIELKKANELPKSFWESYSAFANTKGGYIILGVNEGHPRNDICGVGNAEKIQKDLWNLLTNKNKVSHNVISNDDVVVRRIGEAVIIIIHVKEAPESKKPVYLNDHPEQAWLRTGDGDRRASEEELCAMRRNANPIMDTLNADNFTIDDLDSDSVLIFKEMVSKRYPSKKYLEMPNETFLTEIGVCSMDRATQALHLKRGTVLFLGKVNSIRELFPHYHLDYFNHRGSNPRWSDRVTDDEPGQTEMNLFQFYRIVYEKLHFLLETNFRLGEGQLRMPESDFDETLRECLVNCLVHADYEQAMPSTKIDVYDGWFCFKNPGKMLVSEEQFINGGDSRPRNEIIMKLFRLLGASERQGFGGPLIYKTAEHNDFRKPEIVTSFEYTELKVWNIDLADSYPELTIEEKNVLRFIVKNSEPASLSSMKKQLSYTEHRLRCILPDLVRKGLIQRIGNGPSTRYTTAQGSVEKVTQLQMDLEKIKLGLQ